MPAGVDISILVDRCLTDDLIDRSPRLEEELAVGEAEPRGRWPEARHRQIVDVRVIVAVGRAIEPIKVTAPNDLHGERRLDALVAQLAAVEDHLREAARRRGRAIE